MMDKIFSISTLNPLRFIDVNKQVPPRYYTQSFDDEFYRDTIRDYQEKRCYCQKFANVDSTTLQILSEYTAITAKVFDLVTGNEKYSLVVNEPAVQLISDTLKVYEISLDFSPFPSGQYYVVITVNDGLQDYDYVSEPVSIEESWSNTALLEYTNSENNFSVVFDTGIVFKLRVEAVIDEYTPQADDTLYNDQLRNTTLLNSVPYRQFRFNCGGSAGITEWMVDKLNWILACDQVKIDGEYYTKAGGSKWEINRQEGYPLIGAKINMVPVENAFLQRIKTKDNTPTGGGSGVEKAKNFTNISADIELPNLFNKYIILEKIQFIKYSAGVATINIGTTDGGTEIGTIVMSDIVEIVNIEKGFSADTTLFISGLAGGQFDVNIIYDDPFAKDSGSGGTPNPLSALPKGACIEYEEAEPGDFILDFELATGLGTIGRAWEGWAIRDGLNGTKDMGGRFNVGYKKGDAIYGTIGATGGVDKVTLDLDQIPAHDHKVNGKSTNKGYGSGTAIEPDTTGTLKTGKAGGLPDGTTKSHENLPPYRVSVLIKKIV